MTPVLVALGAVVGAPLRLLATRVAGRDGRDPAFGTLLVNVAGSALLGALLGLRDVSPAVFALVGTGFCGALTTFSTFGADVVRLLEERMLARALGYLAGSLGLGLAAAAIAWAAARSL